MAATNRLSSSIGYLPRVVDKEIASALDAVPIVVVEGVKGCGKTWTLGLLFESLVVRDLRVYAAANRAEVYHFRSSYNDEFDAVVERRDGTWLPVEVKLGAARTDEAARSLISACSRIDTDERGEPANKLVITATGYGYQRDDGVSVVPITALGP